MMKSLKAGPNARPILDAIRACRKHVVQAAVFSAFLNLLYLAPTLYMLQVYDRVVPTRGVTTLVMLSLIFVAAVATIGLLDWIRTRLLVRASTRLDRLLSGSIMDTLMRASKGGKQRTATTLREFDVLRQTLTGVGVLALFDAPWSPIYVLVCFLLHPALGAMALAGSLILLAVTWLNERATNASYKEAMTTSNMAYTGVDNSLSSAGTVQGLGMRNALVRRHVRERLHATDLSTQASFKGAGYMSLTKSTRLLLQSLALGLGALLAIEQQISAGAIFAASLLISRALAPIELITGAWKNMIQAQLAYRTLVDLYEDVGPTRIPTALPDPIGRLEVSNLSVVSPARDRLILNQVSFALEPGELLGVIGPSGAGKSTLMKALVGAMPIHSGTVRIDGASLSDWPEEQLGAAMGYVPQEPTLFRGTIGENIARFATEFDGPGAHDAQIVEAAQACGAHDFILTLPQAYDTQLGWGGAGLSVGQSQRIAVARALFGSPVLMILDEPNASLDADGEAKLVTTLQELRARKVTVIVVAHRSGILASADKLLVMRDGRVDLFGPRQAVLARINGAPPQSIPAAPAAPADQAA